VTPEERARAVVAYFPGIPPGIRTQVEGVVTRAINRAVAQQLGELEVLAAKQAKNYMGRGISGRGYDSSAVLAHEWWARTLRTMRLERRDFNGERRRGNGEVAS
jgi:hypothetical protein